MLLSSIAKQSKHMGTKKLNKGTIVDEELKIIDKKIKKGISSLTGSGITLTNNKIKDTIKVIKSLENSRILVKGTTTKITSQEGRFLNFLKPLMTSGSPLMKESTYSIS